MIEIKCIDKGNCKGLTLGKIYKCDGIKYGGLCYCIINDLGHKENYMDSHFEIVK